MFNRWPSRIAKTFLLAVFFTVILSHNVFASDVVYRANDWPIFKARTKEDVQAKYKEVIDNYGSYNPNNPESYFIEKPSTIKPYAYGKITQDTLDSMANMVNFYRWLIGVNEIPKGNFITRDDLQAQMLLRLWDIGHYVDVAKIPKDLPQDILDLGLPLNHNILAWGYNPVHSIPQWLDEGRGCNLSIGHRTSLLSANISSLGFGSSYDFNNVEEIPFRFGAIGQMLDYKNEIPDRAYFAYPAPGYQPKNFFGYNSSAWTIEVNQKYLSSIEKKLNIKVTWLNMGQVWEEEQTSYSDLIVFAPEFDNIFQFEDADQFKVEISGLEDVASGQAAKIEYTTEFISYEDYGEPEDIEILYESGDFDSNYLEEDVFLYDEYLNPADIYAAVRYANGESSYISGRRLSIVDEREKSPYYKEGLPFFHEISISYKGISKTQTIYITNKKSDKDYKSSYKLMKDYYIKSGVDIYETRDSINKTDYYLIPGEKIKAIQDGRRYRISSTYGVDLGYVDPSDISEDLDSIFDTLYYVKEDINYWDQESEDYKTIYAGDSFYGKIQGEKVYYRNGDYIYRVYKDEVTTKPIKSYAYITERANIRSLSSGQIIAKKYKGDRIEGYMKGEYFHFDLNGVDAKVHRRLLVLARPQIRYIKFDCNVRDRDGNLVGRKIKYQTINAVQIGNQFRFVEDNKIRFIHESCIINDTEELTAYLTTDGNVRSIHSPDEVYFVFPIGSQVKGYLRDGKFCLSDYYDLTIHPSILNFDSPSNLYIKSSANVRDQNLDKTGVIYKGNVIKAVKVGNYYRFTKDDQVSLVHESMVSKSPVYADAYVIERANIRDTNNNKIASYKIGTYIYGQRRGDYVYFTRNGKTAKVYHSLVKFASPRIMTIKESANIRNQDFKIVSTKVKGQKIKAIRIGNYYRFLENGQVRLVWHSLVR
ncbi:MAG: hypothetical protein Q4E50_02800 [Tissierellia bacterium]|nr:hypothetical protein [Tissierellia bacterium]